MPLPGGPTDKYGNRYEGRWTAYCMAEILDENACSIRLEPPGLEGKGFEFWLRRKDWLEYHQVKRQTSRSGSWTLSNLKNEEILKNFLEKLLQEANNHCIFVSTQSANELDSLSDKAKRSSCFEEFKLEFLKPKVHFTGFNDLCKIWNQSDAVVFELLKRIKVETISEDLLQDVIANRLKPIVDGNPLAVADALKDLALDQIHKELSVHDIWHHLSTRGLKPRNWNNDPHVLSRVRSCTDRSLLQHYDATIAGKWIERIDSKVVLGKLNSSEGKRAVFISGEAGAGKSCIIKQVAETLKEQNTPLLAFRIDRLDATQLPEEVGAQLGLPESPAIVLKSIAQGQACVLIIDQLDWVSEASGRYPSFFDCILEIIDQALNYPEMRILLACRKFDLDNDHRFKSLLGENGIAENVQIGRLDHETIKNFIKNNLKLDVNRLNKKQLDLLSIPLHLNLLAEISQDKELEAIDFKTTKDLYDKFWDKKAKDLHQRQEDSYKWVEIVFSLSNYMSNHQTLTAPTSILSKFDILPEAMVSEHILIKDQAKYAFFHQGFFDYVFARDFCAQNLRLVPFLKKDVQHLFRRTQVVQILSRERDDNFADYVTDLELLLYDNEIRYHLKEIVFSMLSELEDPNIDEWRVIAPFLSDSKDPRSRDVKYILFKSIYWINLLISEDQISKWLADAKEDNVNLAITLLTIVQKDQPKIVVDLIEPYFDLSETWNQRLCQIFKRSEIDASEKFFELVLKAVDKGMVDKIEEFDPLNGYFWHAQKKFIKEHPEWACKFLSHYFNKKLITCMVEGRPNPFDQEKGLHVFSWAKIPGTDDKRLKEFIGKKYHIDWVSTAEIVKSEDDKAISITKEDKTLSLTYNSEDHEVILKINNIETDKFIAKEENGELNIYKGFIQNNKIDEEVNNSIKECAKMSPEAFIHGMLPFLLRVIGFNAYRDDRANISTFYDRIWRRRYYHEKFCIYLDMCILSSIEAAMTSLARNKPASFGIMAEELIDLDFDTIHYLIINAYAANGEQFVNDALNYIIKYPICLETGYIEDKFRVAVNLLEAITPYCSKKQIDKIEKLIVEKYPSLKEYEQAQFNLFNGINSSCRSGCVNNRLSKLKEKFGQALKEPPRIYAAGPVISPISEEDAKKMSDEDWLDAILKYDSDDRPFTLDGGNFAGGALELSRILEKIVKLDPSRFAEIIKKIPDTANVHYFDAILRGIADTDLDIKLILDICTRCHSLEKKPCGRWICDVIGKIAENDLPNEALDLVTWYAINDPDPGSEKWRPEGQNKTAYYGGDIVFAGLNTVRGKAADTMSKLLFYDGSRIIYLKSYLEKMVEDPSIQVRSWIAAMLISIFRHNEHYAVELFHNLCKETEDILLSTRHVEIFLKYALENHFSKLNSILTRMIKSKESEVVKVGARQICLASLKVEEARPIMESCLVGTDDQRIGAVEIFSANIAICPDFSNDKLVKFFFDSNKQIRERAAGCFRNLAGKNLADFIDLIDEFIESPSFDSDVEDLIWVLGKTTAKLPDITFKVCKKFIDSTILANNRKPSIEVEVSQLVFRLYSQNKDNSIGESCLDLIDIMIENYVHRIEKDLVNYER